MDIVKILDESTAEAGRGRWESVPSLDTGSGVEYGFRNTVTGEDARANLDQTHLTVEIEGDVVFEGDVPDEDEPEEEVLGCPNCGAEWPAEEGPPCPECGH